MTRLWRLWQRLWGHDPNYLGYVTLDDGQIKHWTLYTERQKLGNVVTRATVETASARVRREIERGERARVLRMPRPGSRHR